MDELRDLVLAYLANKPMHLPVCECYYGKPDRLCTCGLSDLKVAVSAPYTQARRINVRS